MMKSIRPIIKVSQPVLPLFFVLLFILPSNARQTNELDGVLISGSGDGGFWTRSISLFNPDTTRLHQVSVTPQYRGNSTTKSDTLQALPGCAEWGEVR